MIRFVAPLAALFASAALPVLAQPSTDPAMARANALLAQMSEDEKLSLVHGQMPLFLKDRPADIPLAAGIVRGIPRLGVPDLKETDASLGVANAGRQNDDATALPSGLLLASTFDPQIAFAGGAMIGKEARQKGFNVMLDGGVNLVREPRNGRNFEYLGEDPLLAGTLAGQSIRGIQSNHIVSTVKHFALNAQEDGRHVLNAVIDPGALRESDLLAFEIAMETGKPGSIMCAYNKVGGAYACENAVLAGIAKSDWGFKGWIMSDWGAVHSAAAANLGLDQESGEQLDKQVWFGAPLKAALDSGEVSHARLDDMVRRILYGLADNGVLDPQPAPGSLDTVADGLVAQHEAEAGIVLLKNEGGVLPLARTAKRIVVIGGRADIGVASGGGSSQVVPLGSKMFKAPPWGPPWGPGMVFHPSSPLDALKAHLPGVELSYLDGSDPVAAVEAARTADVALMFAVQWTSEGADAPMVLADNQDALIAAVIAANPKTVLVLETGGPVFMPWLDKAQAVVEAWYPGGRGGEAIARVLLGEVDAAGRLPVSFPASLDQTPRPKLDGEGVRESLDMMANPPPSFDVNYVEGSNVGYRWYAKTGAKPLFPFGWGLSYSRFAYTGATVVDGGGLTVSFRVTNIGARAGVDTPQVYASAPGQPRRLIGWGRVDLQPGETRQVTVKVDPRVIATFDAAAGRWRYGGTYALEIGRYAGDPNAMKATARLAVGALQP
jgi:beta-glucosidase